MPTLITNSNYQLLLLTLFIKSERKYLILYILKKIYNQVFSFVFSNSLIIKSKRALALLLVFMLMSSFIFANVQEVFGHEEHVEEKSEEEEGLSQEEVAWQVVESGPISQEMGKESGKINEPEGLGSESVDGMNDPEGLTSDQGDTINKPGNAMDDLEGWPSGSEEALQNGLEDSLNSNEDGVDEKMKPHKNLEGIVVGPLTFTTSSTSGLVPKVGDIATGAVFISNYRNINGEIHFNVKDFTGDLAGGEVLDGITCLDPTAAPPSNVTSEYRGTVIEVNPIIGYVDYQVVITPPGATTGVVGDDGLLLGYQRIGGKVRVYRYFNGSLEVFKYSRNPGITEGNNLYSIVGAEYGVYNMKNERVKVIVVDEQGAGRIDELPVGDYYLKEMIPPMGYALDETLYPITIVFNEVVSVDVFNPPIHNPMGLIVEKYDRETGINAPSGNASLSGAQFTVRYYDRYYSENPMNQGVNPTRTWIMETDEKGQIFLNDDYKVSGDDFYYTLNGVVTLPLGTVTIQESKAPEGYLLNEQVIISQITSKGNVEIVQTFSKHRVRQDVIRGDVEIFKFFEGKEGSIHPLEGVYFTFTSHSTGEKFTIVTDKKGYGSTKQLGISDRGNLIYDTYTVTESHPYTQYGLIPPFEVTISQEGQVIQYSIKNDLLEPPDEEGEPQNPVVPEEPGEPEKPKEPEESKELKTKEQRESIAPQTGDILNLRLMLQCIVMLMSLGIIMITVSWSRTCNRMD